MIKWNPFYIKKLLKGLSTSKHKKMIIIGNAPIDTDLSKFVDSCDCVVRFNDCRTINVNTGTKIDILILNNTGNPSKVQFLKHMLKDRTEAVVENELPYLANAKKIWFARPNAKFLYNYLEKQFPKEHQLRNYELDNFEITKGRDLTSEMISAQNIPMHKVSIIDEELYVKTWQKLLSHGNTKAIVPSTGMLGIEMILYDKTFADYEKFIIGFGWEGYNGHPWKLEEKLVNSYIDSGILKSIEYKLNKISIDIKNTENNIIFSIKQKKEVKIAFYLLKEDSLGNDIRIDTQWYSENYEYRLEKKKFTQGRYRVQYFIVEKNEVDPGNTTKKQSGYFEYIKLQNLSKDEG